MIIVDTGYWVALANPKDSYHQSAISIASGLKEPLITTWPVITETCYILLTRIGNSSQTVFLQNMANEVFDVFEIFPSYGHRLSELMVQYADQPMDLADASLVILAEHLGHGRILSVDQKDFSTYRWKSRMPFQNLLEP